MKFSYVLAITVLTSMVSGKNVFDLELLQNAVHEESNSNDKREANAKPIIQVYKDDGIIDKREAKAKPKNVFKFKFDNDIKKRQQDSDENSVTFKSYNNLLNNIIPQDPSISIFGGYIRDNFKVSKLTESNDDSILIIAPTNDAISHKLNGLKPWEFPNSLNDINEEDEEKLVGENIKSFLYSHIIKNFGNLQNSKIIENVHNSKIETKLMNGDLISINQNSDNGEFTLLTKNNELIKVESISEVDNGYLFIINDVLSKPQ